jgi:hypothetical protein
MTLARFGFFGLLDPLPLLNFQRIASPPDMQKMAAGVYTQKDAADFAQDCLPGKIFDCRSGWHN